MRPVAATKAEVKEDFEGGASIQITTLCRQDSLDFMGKLEFCFTRRC